jgi:hypothetical protein
VIAIDWSGRARGEADHLWLAEAGPDGLVRLEGGARRREELVGHLLSLSGEPVVVGLDFAFSFPAWYVRERGWTAVREVWSAIVDEGELLLDEERDEEGLEALPAVPVEEDAHRVRVVDVLEHPRASRPVAPAQGQSARAKALEEGGKVADRHLDQDVTTRGP